MVKKSALAGILAALFAFTFTAPASAITYGEPDGDEHPYVGLMVAIVDGAPAWRCTGTLISPTVFLTAGHCTDGADSIQVWFDTNVEDDRGADGYPFVGDVSGDPYTHPDYDPDAFYVNDLGIVVLDKRVRLDEYGALPEEGLLSELATERGLQDVTFTAVGYGLQNANKNHVEALLIRMVSHPELIQVDNGIVGDDSVLLTNNANTGGTCFGDSGGPNFIGDTNVIAGVTSFGLNQNCGGTGGVYRIDTAEDLAWITSFLTGGGKRK